MDENKPQVRSGWGTGPQAGAPMTSNMGMAQKSAAASYWDAKTTEIFIPEMGEEGAQDGAGAVDVIVSEPASVDTKMTGLHELNKEFALNVPSATPDGIDISLLTSVIRPIADLIETDMQWNYLGLQAEIGQNYREKYQEGALVDGKVSIVGAKASGH